MLLRDETCVMQGDPHTLSLDTSNIATARTVEFFPSTQLTSGSSQRAHQAIRLIKVLFRRELKCIVTQQSAGIAITCPDATDDDIQRVCTIAEHRLSRLKQEPLTAKMVEEILAITGAERRRWSKDGRLPNAGHALFSQGRKQVGLFLYPPDAIRQLANRPDQIADWRSRDKDLLHSTEKPSRRVSKP
jgi:hypothetical protein